MQRILAIGAHPDDIEIGCFGSLARFHSEGWQAFFLILTLGEDGGARSKRSQEALNAASLIDAAVQFGQFPSADLPLRQREVIGLIESSLASLSPDLIMTHSPRDQHQDHRAAAEATFSATRRRPARVICYDSTLGLSGLDPQYFINIDGFLPEKLKAIAMHHSQVHHGYMAESAVVAEAEHWGRRLGDLGVYEAFEVRLIVE